MRALLAALPLCGLLAACPKYQTYVKSSETALGRIVVYRNGVAFYERRATIEGSTLTLKVPSDKVDDFLKSLTITDATTHKPLPISYPTADAAGGEVEMVVQLPGPGPHDLLLTYVVEAASWKPSYRIVVKDDNKVQVEAWAIVDNTSGEDWNGVRVGVGSSSALSFRYDLRSVRTVQRQKLEDQQRFAQAPPTGGAVHKDTEEKVLGMLADADLAAAVSEAPIADDEMVQVEAAPTAAESMARRPATGGGRASRASAAPAAPPASARDYREERRQEQLARQRASEARIRQLAQTLNAHSGTIVVEGYATAGEANPEARSLERAHALRNQLISAGVAPARVRVVGRGVVPGQQAGARLVEEAAPPSQAAAQASAATEDGEPVSESHFESSSPVTVKRGTSAMVSVLAGDTAGEVVYLYDPNAERGNDRFAFRAVMFKNPSAWALEGGPVTFFGDNRFIGEGITESIPPGATGVVPFALDRQILVERTSDTSDRIARLITLQRGVLTAEVQHLRRHKLRIVNRLHQPTALFLRHTSQKGWQLSGGPKPYEKVGETYLFKIPVGAGETSTFEFEESTPMQRTVDLRSPSGLELVRIVVEVPKEWPQIADQVRALLEVHKEIADHEQAIVSLRERVEEYRARLAELEQQLISLKEVRAGGQELMQHLRAKMMDVSERVQKATIEIVDHQQKLLLARVRFQDTVAEMTFVQPEAKGAGSK